MNGNLHEAKRMLKEMAMKHDMKQADCYDGIRHLSLVMLAVCSDTEWIKRLMLLILVTILGIQGVGMVV